MLNREIYLASIPGIQKLFKDAFDREISSDLLIWRFADNPMNKTPVTLMEENAELIAHFASTPNEFELENRILRGGMAGTVMTHPSCRGRGLFQKLAEENETELKDDGFDFLYCFSNRNSDPIFLQMNWLPVYEIPTLHLLLPDIEHLSATAKPFSFDDGFNRFDYDGCSTRDALIAIPRTRSWLRWRYTNHPLNEYRNLVVSDGDDLLGFGVIKVYRAGGTTLIDLVDFFSKDLMSFMLLVDQVKAFAYSNEATGVNAWAPRHHYSHRYLTKSGFIHQGQVTYFTVKSLKNHLRDHLKSFSNWWILMGDSDNY